MPLDWLPESRRLLAAGDTWGALAAMVGQAGFAPGPLAAMPPRGLNTFLRLFMPKRQWRTIEALLEATLAENEQIARLDDGTADRYAVIGSPVLLLGGSKSPAFTAAAMSALDSVIPDSTMEIIGRLGHAAPARKAPRAVSRHFLRFLRASR